MPANSSNLILAFVDFSEVTDAVGKLAADLALALQKELIFIHVITPDADFEGDEMRRDVSRAGIAAELHRNHLALGALEAEAKQRGISATSLLVRGKSSRGAPTSKMLREIARLKPQLIVMGTHGHGALHTLLLGSASAAVVHKATCPVILVPSRLAKPS
jgi:nucleotide-binding universal stress UspA family protein